jgi:Tol biopolymer transport system component
LGAFGRILIIASFYLGGRDAHIWVYELSGTIAPRQLTVGGSNRFPVWSSDGEWIAYQSDRDGDRGIFRQRADGSGIAERLTTPEAGVDHVPDSWSQDGQNLSFTAFKGTDASVWIYSLKDKKPTLFAQAPSRLVARAVFSPDGQWLAYQSNEVGKTQVWVQPFPATRERYPVVDGGQPFWSQDGKELFYRPSSDVISAIRITTRPSFAFSNPMPLNRSAPCPVRYERGRSACAFCSFRHFDR